MSEEKKAEARCWVALCTMTKTILI